MPRSMYEYYVEERDPRAKVLTWKDKGFAKYIIEKGECYIEEIYVLPRLRKTGVAEGMADEITVIAKEKGCSVLTGSVCVGAKGDTNNLKILLAYKMKLSGVSGNMIYFSKNLGG